MNDVVFEIFRTRVRFPTPPLIICENLNEYAQYTDEFTNKIVSKTMQIVKEAITSLFGTETITGILKIEHSIDMDYQKMLVIKVSKTEKLPEIDKNRKLGNKIADDLLSYRKTSGHVIILHAIIEEKESYKFYFDRGLDLR